MMGQEKEESGFKVHGAATHSNGMKGMVFCNPLALSEGRPLSIFYTARSSLPFLNKHQAIVCFFPGWISSAWNDKQSLPSSVVRGQFWYERKLSQIVIILQGSAFN